MELTVREDCQIAAHIFYNGCKVKFVIWENRQLFLDKSPRGDLVCYAFFHPKEYQADILPDGVLLPIWQEEIGEIHLVKGEYGSGVVTHECAHACIHWMEICGFSLAKKDEEFAFEIGMMVSKFWNWHYELLRELIGMS